MADILNFSDFTEGPELETLSREELEAYLKTLRDRIEALDWEEPADMNSEAYELWGNRHEELEELEDLADEVLDLLDELGKQP